MRVLLVSALLAVALTSTGCASMTAFPTPGGPPTTKPADPKATTKANPPPDPTAEATPSPVGRANTKKKSGAKLIKGASGKFNKTLTWADGVAVTVTKIEHGESEGVGPGSMPGTPITTFTMQLTNGSASTIDATSVVVTATYGKKPGHQASGVYGEQSADFDSTVRPDKSATAVYTFSIPTDKLNKVRLNVDLDGLHALATFDGAVK